MTLHIAPTKNIAICRHLRRVVFIDEQGVLEADEIDDQDGHAVHLLAYWQGQAVGSARLLRYGDMGKIGRVCVLAELRCKGIGAALIHASVSHFQGQTGVKKVKLGAQTHALGFYAKLGFAPIDASYLDAGIDHQDMLLIF
ncbi:MAG: GNAT family N-acetyltransferase [Paracoccaceae bacterium]|jgi:predicted GNAT family N-acyltransferase